MTFKGPEDIYKNMNTWKLTLIIFTCLHVAASSKSWKKLKAFKRHEGFRISCCFIDIFCSEVCIEKGDRPTYKRSVATQVHRRKTHEEIRESSRKLINIMKNAKEFRRVWKKWYVMLNCLNEANWNCKKEKNRFEQLLSACFSSSND